MASLKTVSCALCQCTFGEVPMPFNVMPINRVLGNSRPLGCIMDFAPMVNIVSFVKCKAPTHPLVILTGIAPCIPITTPWIPSSPNVIVGTFPSLAMGDKSICAWGGVIEIKFPGQTTII